MSYDLWASEWIFGTESEFLVRRKEEFELGGTITISLSYIPNAMSAIPGIIVLYNISVPAPVVQ